MFTLVIVAMLINGGGAESITPIQVVEGFKDKSTCEDAARALREDPKSHQIPDAAAAKFAIFADCVKKS